jgi:uncharacterized protein with PIN domain
MTPPKEIGYYWVLEASMRCGVCYWNGKHFMSTEGSIVELDFVARYEWIEPPDWD